MRDGVQCERSNDVAADHTRRRNIESMHHCCVAVCKHNSQIGLITDRYVKPLSVCMQQAITKDLQEGSLPNGTSDTAHSNGVEATNGYVCPSST